jgi:hypothetical protein
MNERREPWYRNPFWLGSAGLVVVLASYILLVSQVGGAALSPLALTAHLVFLLGVVIMLAAGVVWFLDARRPEPPAEDGETNEAGEG